MERRYRALDTVHGQVVIPIGSHTSPEIAISVLAKMTAIRNGVKAVGGISLMPAAIS